MTVSEYAEHRGCAPTAVKYAISSGRIAQDAGGEIDPVAADRDWEANTNHAKARNGARGSPAAAGSFAEAHAARERHAGLLAELEYEERLGNLVSRQAVELEYTNRWQIVRDAMLNLPSRIAALLAAEADPVAVHNLLEAEIQNTLEQLTERRPA
jgi:hypothetical protein